MNPLSKALVCKRIIFLSSTIFVVDDDGYYSLFILLLGFILPHCDPEGKFLLLWFISPMSGSSRPFNGLRMDCAPTEIMVIRILLPAQKSLLNLTCKYGCLTK